MDIKLIQIGNSKGIRLPKKLISKYKLDTGISLIEKDDGILIKPQTEDEKLSWEQTYKDMAEEKEDWKDLDITSGDGL